MKFLELLRVLFNYRYLQQNLRCTKEHLVHFSCNNPLHAGTFTKIKLGWHNFQGKMVVHKLDKDAEDRDKHSSNVKKVDMSKLVIV